MEKLSEGWGRIYSQPLQGEESIMKALPSEMFVQILLNLSDKDKENASLVNKEWNLATIDTDIRQEQKIVENLLNFIIDNLDAEKNVDILKVLKNLRDTLAINLKNKVTNLEGIKKFAIRCVKKSCLGIKEDLMRILKNKKFDLKELENLEVLSKDIGITFPFADFFFMAKIEKKIYIAEVLPNGRPLHQKDKAFGEIAEELALAGYYDKATELVRRISPLFENVAFADISRSLSAKRDFENAIIFVGRITRRHLMYAPLEWFIITLIKDRNFDPSLIDKVKKLAMEFEDVSKAELIKLIVRAVLTNQAKA